MTTEKTSSGAQVPPGKKTLESLVYLRNFVEKYERYKEDLLFTLSKNSTTHLNNEDSLNIPQEQKPRKKFTVTKPSSLVHVGKENKYVTKHISNLCKNNKTDKGLNYSEDIKKSKKVSLMNKNKGTLCKDSTKKQFNNEGVFTLCTQNKRKKINKKISIFYEKKETNINSSTFIRDQGPSREKSKHLQPLDISNALIELQNMDIGQIKARVHDLLGQRSIESRNETDKLDEEYANGERKITTQKDLQDEKEEGKTVSIECNQEEIEKLLRESRYTKSEMDILLEELGEFPKMEEAIQRFTDLELKRDENLRPTTEKAGMSCQDYEKSIPGEMFIDQTSDIFPETTEEIRLRYSIEKDTDEELRKRASLTKPFLMHSKLEGTLYKDMARYYTAKIEALTNLKKHFKGEILLNLKEVLGNTLQEYGLPENETVLQELISRSEEKVNVAQDYESIRKMKISRREKYESKTTETLMKLFSIPVDEEKDLMHILAPYLRNQTPIEQQKTESKTTRDQHSTKSKKKEKKEKKVKEEGPFNIMKMTNIRRSVWRAALKRAKRKIKYLKLSVEHRKKYGLLHEKYHEHFADYFKKKRTEIKQLRSRRKIPAMIKIRNVDLSEAESSSSFSSGDYYPEKALMNSMFYNYDELIKDISIQALKGKKYKCGKVEKLKREKLGERTGVTSSKWAPHTEQEELAWYQKASKTYAKKRDRIVENYLYSSGDELTGLKNSQKKNKQAYVRQLAESLIPTEIPRIQNRKEKSVEKKHEEPKESKDFETVVDKFKAVCFKYKMKYIYAIICNDSLLKCPYNNLFMTSVGRMGDALIPYENDSSFHTSVINKFLKMAVRTCLGMFLIMQKENDALDENCEASNKAIGEKDTSKVIPLPWLLKNATIAGERKNNWIKRYLGISNSLKTEEKMPLWMKLYPTNAQLSFINIVIQRLPQVAPFNRPY